MSYETGTSTGPNDLLDKLKVFLDTLDGWMINKWEVDSANPTGYHVHSGMDGTGKRLHIQKTATDGTVMYFNFRSVVRGIVIEEHDNSSTPISGPGTYRAEVTGIVMNGSTGYNAGSDWDQQPGAPKNVADTANVGVAMGELSVSAIPSYYFFASGDTVIVAAASSTGIYEWLGFGCLEKEGVYTGGQFYSGSQDSYRPQYEIYQLSPPGDSAWAPFCMISYADIHHTAVYLDIDSDAGWRYCGYQGLASGGKGGTLQLSAAPAPADVDPNYLSGYAFNVFAVIRSPNFYNSLAPMAQNHFFVERASGNWSLIGEPKDFRIINISLYSPGDEIVLGSDTWVVLPAHSKADADGRLGFAIKKVI